MRRLQLFTRSGAHCLYSGTSSFTQVLFVVTDLGTERCLFDFPMDSVAGARRTPGRLKTGGVPPKPPATILLSSVALGVLGLRLVVQGRLGVISYALLRQPYLLSSSLRATSALCRGTGQQNIAFQMFLQLLTLRRQVSRPVAAGVYPFLKDVAGVTMCLQSRRRRWVYLVFPKDVHTSVCA